MMISILAAGLSDAAATTASAVDLGRGAIVGAYIIAAAFLAGYAAIRRSGLAVCALVMVAGAAALEFSWLGFLSAMSPEVTVLILGLFAAAAIAFLSSSIGAAKYNPILGGLMFTAALIIAGMGVINFFDRVDVTGVMRWSVLGLGGFALILAITQAFRGDAGARMILPGVLVAMIAPFVGSLGGGVATAGALLPHALFTVGVLAASLVALTETGVISFGSSQSASAPAAPAQFFAPSGHDEETHAGFAHHGGKDDGRADIELDSSLAQVLDYAGVAIWDWSPTYVDQTESLPQLLGADSAAPFTPEALANFIDKEDAQRFQEEVASPIDGPFDVALKLFDGRKVRIRGARAANEETGELTRIVAFIETASPIFKPTKNNFVSDKTLREATAAAIVPAAASLLSSKMVDALEKGDIVAAFQPIVALDDKKVVGYEALARWRGENGANEGPETFVRAAEQAGKGAELAKAMLDQAASFLADKIKADKRGKYFVAMNVSWGQMRDAGFADTVRETIARYALPKDSLVLELTEGDAVSDADNAGRIFAALKEAGASLAFDDFGAGFSCLTNLRKYDFDYLKIDKSFAADLETGGDGAKIAAALGGLGKELGLKVIVEGIETKTAAKVAAKLGLDLAQGYAFGMPEEVPAANLAAPVAAAEETAIDAAAVPAPAPKVVETALAEEEKPADVAETSADLAANDAEEDGDIELTNSDLADDAPAEETLAPAGQRASWLWRRSPR